MSVQRRSETGSHAPRPPTILLVEDNRELIGLMIAWLRQARPDALVDWAFSPADARSLLWARQYDLVLSDYVLEQHHDGFEVRRLWSKSQRRGQFAMMTAVDENQLLRAAGTRRAPFLRKPFSASELCDFVAAIVGPSWAYGAPQSAGPAKSTRERRASSVGARPRGGC